MESHSKNVSGNNPFSVKMDMESYSLGLSIGFLRLRVPKITIVFLFPPTSARKGWAGNRIFL